MKETGFLKVIQNSREEQDSKDPMVERETIPDENDEKSVSEEQDQVEVVQVVSKQKHTEEPEGEPEPVATTKDKPDKNIEKETRKLRNARLYFIDVDETGAIRLEGVVRPVYYHDAPLTSTIEALLEGLMPSELNKELITLVPEKTQLISATVEGDTAYLNFNEAFRFNTLGSEGLKAQLKQIVYTATEFSTVKNVQVLIEGRKYEYLGPEGIFIGRPLNRNSF